MVCIRHPIGRQSYSYVLIDSSGSKTRDSTLTDRFSPASTGSDPDSLMFGARVQH